MKTTFLKHCALCIVHCALFAACLPEGVLQHDMQEVKADGWLRRDTLTFCVDSAARQAWVCVRIDGTYGFSSLWLRVGGDTVEIPVGEMTGGGLRQCEHAVACPQPGELKVSHLMRQQCLEGVREVGLKTSR